MSFGPFFAAGVANPAAGSWLGTCSTAAATAEKVVTLTDGDGFELRVGATIVVKFSATNTGANPTLNVNGTGAYSVYYNTAVITTGSLGYAGYANRYITYVWDGTYWVFVGWSIDSNTTYSNASLGQGYGTCATAAATAAKVVTLSSYALTVGGLVAVKFTYANTAASPTLNINSKGAKAIYYKGAALTDTTLIQAGDTCLFLYNGYYHLLAIDRGVVPSHTHAASAITAGTFGGAVVAANDTAYTTYKVRNAAILSAVPSSMTNGTIAFAYS